MPRRGTWVRPNGARPRRCARERAERAQRKWQMAKEAGVVGAQIARGKGVAPGGWCARGLASTYWPPGQGGLLGMQIAACVRLSTGATLFVRTMFGRGTCGTVIID